MGNLNTAIDNDYYPSAHVKKKRLRRSRSNRAVQHSSSSDINGTIASLLLIAAIPFGAAHENTWLSLLVILSCVTIWQLLRRGKNPVNASQQSSFQVFSLGLICVVGYVFLQSFRKLSLPQYPLPEVTEQSHLSAFFSVFLPGFALFYLPLVISYRSALFIRRKNSSNEVVERQDYAILGVTNAVMYTTWILSIIGIAHWFTDNGNLFWVFPSLHSGPMQRVRWPLVNPDHFGFLLFPGLLLSLATFSEKLISFRDLTSQGAERQVRPHSSRTENSAIVQMRRIAEATTSVSFQKAVGALCIHASGLLLVCVAIFGTLSRAIWGASFLASAIFLSLTLSQWSSIRPGSHERGHRVRSRIRSLLILLSILFVGGSVVVLTLGLGAGKEIVLNRLAYGLLYTHDDMRWQLYADSIPLLSWLGLGTEGWRDAFPAVMSPGLAGIRPDYLHSEALQFMIEYGYIGAFVLCLPLTYLLLTVIRTPA